MITNVFSNIKLNYDYQKYQKKTEKTAIPVIITSHWPSSRWLLGHKL